jgi:hypothetical protein
VNASAWAITFGNSSRGTDDLGVFALLMVVCLTNAFIGL